MIWKLVWLPLALATALSALDRPVPEMPRVYVDTSYRHPSGATLFVGRGGDLQAALDKANPGDTIVLEAGTTFTGHFVLPPKTGNGWIYIQSSAIDNMAHPGQRTSPADTNYMPRIQTQDSLSAITVLPGATNYRLVGLEISPAEGAPRVWSLVNIDTVSSEVEVKLRSLGKTIVPQLFKQDQFPQNIVIDRCYIHGSDTQNSRRGVVANGVAIAVIDSYISDIHDSTMDSQGILMYRTPGPIKIVNNFISATTENIMSGGAGGAANLYVPSDIEIRKNLLFKPLSWIPLTSGGKGKWSVKNNLELKNAQRVLVSGNTLENDWQSAQNGCSVVLTVRTSDSGNSAVVDDVRIEKNIIKNVNCGFSSLAVDDLCSPKFAPNCTNPGEAKRWNIANNLILLRDARAPGGFRPMAFSVAPGLTDVIFQHNTVVPAEGTNCYASLYFNLRQGLTSPLTQANTNNLWILDNVLCRQPSGDSGLQLTSYMGVPAPLDTRFAGNVMYVPRNSREQVLPRHNLSTSAPIAYVDLSTSNYRLLTPKSTQTGDDSVAGVDTASLMAAINQDSTAPAVLRPQVAILRPNQTKQFASPSSDSSWSLTPLEGNITAQGLYTAPRTVSGIAGVTVCATPPRSPPLCASIVLNPHSTEIGRSGTDKEGP
jgi:hypothetical protein